MGKVRAKTKRGDAVPKFKFQPPKGIRKKKRIIRNKLPKIILLLKKFIFKASTFLWVKRVKLRGNPK